MEKTFFVVKTIIYDKSQKKFLMLQRSNYKGDANVWDFVGGSVQFAEDNKKALKREAKEEAGIILNNTKIIDLYSNKANIPEGQFIFALYFCDDFEYMEDDIKLSEEHINYKWINISEIDEYELYSSIANVKDFIVKYISELS